MKKINTYLHKKVLVLGLAKSGVGAAALLHKLGAFVTVNDYKPLTENPEAQGLIRARNYSHLWRTPTRITRRRL